MKARLPKEYQPQSRSEQLRQIQEMQNQMESFQNDLQEKEFTAKAGGDAVQVTMLGKRQITKLDIDKDIIDPEDSEMLADLIAAAVNQCLADIDAYTEEGMSGLTGGLSLPGMF